MPRKPFSIKQAKEFLKTAELITATPWTMSRAAAYLRELVEQNGPQQQYHTPHARTNLNHIIHAHNT